MNKAITYPIKKAGSALDKLAMGTSAVAGAAFFSQVPGYISHYTQRLGGHAAEAIRNVDSWQNIADKTTKGNLDTLINVYTNSGVAEVIEAGKKCAADIFRGEYLQNAYYALTNSNIWSKPKDFVTNFDYEIALETIKDFVPNIPLSLEGAVYTAAGIIAGVGIYCGVKKFGKPLVKGLYNGTKNLSGKAIHKSKGIASHIKSRRKSKKNKHRIPSPDWES